MAELAAHLADHVLGGLPVRQWVLTVPHRLRYAMAWNHELCRAVLGVFTRALLAFETKRAEERGIPTGRGGAVTAIQRFGSSLNLNVHFHTLAVQGVFVDDGRGGLRFAPNPEPTNLEVIGLLSVVKRRITRLARRRGIELEHPNEEIDSVDPLAADSPLLSGICGASVVGRTATGPRAGLPVVKIGDSATPTFSPSHHAPCVARRHAGDSLRVRSPESTCFCITECSGPPRGFEAQRFRPPGSEKFHPRGARAEAASAVVRGGPPSPAPRRRPEGKDAVDSGFLPSFDAAPGAFDDVPRPRRGRWPHTPWADLLQRTFGIDILACPGCGGRLRFLATIEHPATIRKILDHLGLPTAPPAPLPARSPPGDDQVSFPFADLAD